MKIRPMLLTDVDQVVQLENKTWTSENTPGLIPVTSKEKIITDFENGTHFLVAEENQVIIGVLDYRPYYPFPSGRHIVTFGIAVFREKRGQGIGRQLIEEFFKVAQADDFQKVLINVLSTNLKAIAFYEKLGFHLEARLPKQFYIDKNYIDDLIFSYYLEETYA